MRRLGRRLDYLFNHIDPDGVELLCAALSIAVAALLAYRGNAATAIDYAYAYAGLCLIAGCAKFGGVLLEWRWLRLFGLFLGAIFWVTLSYALLRKASNSITWLSFAVLALAQLWAARRVWSP